MPNQLARETSPYLLQHADNPVDWYPWGDEAIGKAREVEKPIFLSIGYSACHWCHVMERESFENAQIAAMLNEYFVCIKVDREERPDLDHVYMQAVQLISGHGGWPMSVFLTPDLKPFFGGTYWPPSPRMGLPGFDQVLRAVADAWKNRRRQAIEQSDLLTQQIRQLDRVTATGDLDPQFLSSAATELEHSFDRIHGGFGSAPKFPQATAIQVCLRLAHGRPQPDLADLARLSLERMARGGIHDHLAGGFSRYSVDARWLVPHFEKMLYDNALLADAYLDAFLYTQDGSYSDVARKTLDYVLAYMTDPQGGFHGSEDADSEGEEGKFYLWTPREVHAVLGPDAAERFCYVYDVSETGNFEGRSILNLPKTIEQCARLKGWDAKSVDRELADSRERLRQVRDRRVRPAKDDKVLVSWNALMIQTMARGAGILEDPKYLAASQRAATFILSQMQREDGRLLHTWRNGQAKLPAYLDDYSALANALVTLYESTFDEHWIDEAFRLMDAVLERFSDPHHGGLFDTASDQEALIARSKNLQDSATPSGNALAAVALLRLGTLGGRSSYVQAAGNIVRLGAGIVKQAPLAAPQMLSAIDRYLGPAREVVVMGRLADEETAAVLRGLRKRFLSNCVVAFRPSDGSEYSSPLLDPVFAGKKAIDGRPTLFVCQNFTCQTPVVGLARIEQAIDQLSAAAARNG